MNFSKEIVSKIIFVLFNLGMAFFFLYSFLFPIETNYWLAKNGYLLIILELASFLFILLGFQYFVEKQKSVMAIFAIVFITLWTLGFIVAVKGEILLFFYFLVSSAIKIFNIKQNKEKTEPKKTANKLTITMAVPIMLSALIAVFFQFFGIFFKAQQNLLSQFVDNPAFIAAWGFWYFILILIFNLKESEINQKKI